ncbi:MAG: inositol monophosphatase family protein [bacterium]
MLKVAIQAALEAGRFLKENVGRIKQIERKHGQETNLVTEIDRKAEEIIITMIKQSYPDHDFLGEESGSHQAPSEYRWVIDPLDGTTNYTHGFHIYCVSIGLEVRGEIVLGAIYDPTLNELFSAERGKGAFLNGKSIHVSGVSSLIDSMLVTGFPYIIKQNPDHAIEHFNNFLMEAQALRRLGSAAIDMCYVASGKFEGFWEVALNPWDMAAGMVIIEEAGGKITDFHGNPTTIYSKQILASNGIVHNQLMAVLKKGMGNS